MDQHHYDLEKMLSLISLCRISCLSLRSKLLRVLSDPFLLSEKTLFKIESAIPNNNISSEEEELKALALFIECFAKELEKCKRV